MGRFIGTSTLEWCNSMTKQSIVTWKQVSLFGLAMAVLGLGFLPLRVLWAAPLFTDLSKSRQGSPAKSPSRTEPSSNLDFAPQPQPESIKPLDGRALLDVVHLSLAIANNFVDSSIDPIDPVAHEPESLDLSRPTGTQGSPLTGNRLAQAEASSLPEPRPLATSAADLIPLNPNPDNLYLPTTAAEIEIDLNQPITLVEALQVAVRNNLSLKISELQLEQQHAQLRQALGSLYPTLSLQTSLGQNTSPAGQPVYLPLILQQQQQLQLQQQQQGQQELLGQELEASRILTNQVNRLQQRFQGPQLTSFADQQNLELQQQIQQLQNSATVAATPPPFQPITLPPVSNLNFNNFFTNVFGATSGATFNSALTLNYTIFTSGNRAATIQAARDQVRFSELEVQRQLDQLILDVSNAYYLAQQAEVQVQIAEAAVANAAVSLRDARAFEQAGLGTTFDVLQAEVNLANAQQNLNQANNLQLTSRRQLAQRLNISETADVSLADRVGEDGIWEMSLDETIILAFDNRVELEQRLLQRNIALQNRRAALASVLPQLSLFANTNVLDKVADSLNPRVGYSVGLQIQVALFDGGNARASAARQEANAAIAEEQFANTKNEIRLEVEDAYINLRSNQTNITTARTAVTQATEGLRLARLRFQAGVGTQQDVTNAEVNLTQAQGNLLAAILNYNRALAALKRSVGYVDGLGRQIPSNP